MVRVGKVVGHRIVVVTCSYFDFGMRMIRWLRWVMSREVGIVKVVVACRRSRRSVGRVRLKLMEMDASSFEVAPRSRFVVENPFVVRTLVLGIVWRRQSRSHQYRWCKWRRR